jgi:hypothetical protein
MRYCPRCRSEYQDWVKACIDCGAELTDHLPPTPSRADMAKAKSERIKSGKIVTVAKYTYPLEAQLGQAKLESEGIWSFVADVDLVSANQFYSMGLDGVKLQVREADFEAARAILEHYRKRG